VLQSYYDPPTGYILTHSGPFYYLVADGARPAPQHKQCETCLVRRGLQLHRRFVLTFILVFITHVHTTNIPCLQTSSLSLCTTAHPRYTRFANTFGASVSEAAMRPNPR
jgi:hypothetical protein